MLFYALSVFCVAAFGLSATGQSTLPVTTCKRDSAGHSACLKRALEEAWPRFIKGLPEFDFPPLDPIFYKYGKLVLNSGVIRAEVILSNITAVGLSKARFNDVRSHFLDNVFRLEIDVQVPKILVEGDVKMNGTLLEFRTTGQDHFNMTTEDVRGTWDLSGHVINDTWIVEHFNVFPSVRKLEIYFDDFFQGNKELNTIVLNLVNEFWPPLYRVILPVASDIWDSWLTDFANKIFSKVSFSTIFP